MYLNHIIYHRDCYNNNCSYIVSKITFLNFYVTVCDYDAYHKNDKGYNVRLEKHL